MHARPGRPSAPLSTIASNVSRETGALARDCEEMQDLISGILMTTQLSENSFVALQNLDAMTQRLAGLADFLAHLAPTLDSGWMVDAGAAADQVKLSDLGRRLVALDAAA